MLLVEKITILSKERLTIGERARAGIMVIRASDSYPEDLGDISILQKKLSDTGKSLSPRVTHLPGLL